MSDAGIDALNRVAETNVVVRFDPFQRITELETNPVPFTVSVNALHPATLLDGLRLVILGIGLLIVNVMELEVPPPLVGLNTVTWAVPATAMSDAGIDALNWVEDTNVVVRFEPFQRTTYPETNPLPFTVSVNAAPPAVAVEGLRLVIAGAGFTWM